MRKTGGDKTCVNCAKSFHVPAWREKYNEVKFCSMECLWSGRKPRAKKPKIEVFCEECGNPYLVESHRASKTRFCSFKCKGAAYFREMNAANRPPEALDPRNKICSICDLEKPRSEFFKRLESQDGLRSDCKACHRERVEKNLSLPGKRDQKNEMDRAYYEREADRINRESREWYSSLTEEEKTELSTRAKKYRDVNTEKLSEYRRLKRSGPDGDKVRARRRADYRKNKPKYVAAARARDDHVKLATPPWADLKAIEEFYVQAERLSRETGIKHHVDHIYPLVSKVMCGLHVPANLQVLPYIVNLKKGNTILEPAEVRCCAWPTAAFLPGAVPA